MNPEAPTAVTWPQYRNITLNEMTWLYNLNCPQWAAR